MKKLLFILALISSQAVAAPASMQDVKAMHMKTCLKQGNLTVFCECTFNKGLQEISLNKLAEYEQLIAQGYRADSTTTRKMGLIARRCTKEISLGQNTSQNPANGNLELPPMPPPLPNNGEKIEPLPQIGDIIPKNSDTNFIDQIGKPTPPPEQIKPVDTKPITTNKPRIRPVIKAAPKPVHYFGQYDQLMFNLAAQGNLEGLRAVTPEIPDFNIKNAAGDTPLIHSVKYGQIVSIKFMLSQGANVNERNIKNQTALHVASFMKRPDIVELLINNRANVNDVYGSGLSPVTLAIRNQDAATLNLLVNAGATTSMLDAAGNNLLHLAATGSNPQVINVLVRTGINVNAPNHSGMTPLMVASYAGSAATADALIKGGANIYLADPYGRTAANLAQSAGKMDVLNLLMNYQAGRY